MEVHVELTRDDLFAYNMFYVAHSEEARRQMRIARITWSILVITLVAIMTFIIYAIGIIQTIAGCTFSLIIMSVLYVSLVLWSHRRSVRRRIRRLVNEGEKNALLVPRTLKLTEEVLSSDGALTGGWVRWKAVNGIIETEEHLFILLGPALAHIIPKRFFRTPIDAQHFVELARRYQARQSDESRDKHTSRPIS